MADRFEPDAGPTGTMLGPRSVERPADAGATLVGGIDDTRPARVDGGGLISPAGATWALDWWVGADDRWHIPAREPSIRQRRLGPGPIIETSLRVPSGDVIATAYPVVAGGRAATVVEIRNDSPVPVALGLAIRPYAHDGRPSAGHRLELAPDRRAVIIDDDAAVLLPRPPNEAGADPALDLFDAVTAGQALSWRGPVEGTGANAVCLYPLPHSTSLRFTLPAPSPSGAPTTGDGAAVAVDRLRPDAVPDADAVVRGWTAIVERGGSFRFPDPGLTDLAGAARARLILAAPSLPDRIEDVAPAAGLVLGGLVASGHGEECRPALDRLAESFPSRLPGGTAAVAAADLVVGAVAAAELLGEPELIDRLLAPVTQLTHLVDRTGDAEATARARGGLARLAEGAGQPEAAEHLRRDLEADADDGEPGLEAVTALAGQATPSGGWTAAGLDGVDAIEPAARFWLRARRLLIADPGPEAGGDQPIRLLPAFPTAWLGGELEVHRAPVAGVRVSFAIRWHGYRPALLWEVDGANPTGGAVRLTCPGLDPEWSTDQPRGEALLVGSSIELSDVPAPGDSFQ